MGGNIRTVYTLISKPSDTCNPAQRGVCAKYQPVKHPYRTNVTINSYGLVGATCPVLRAGWLHTSLLFTASIPIIIIFYASRSCPVATYECVARAYKEQPPAVSSPFLACETSGFHLNHKPKRTEGGTLVKIRTGSKYHSDRASVNIRYVW